MSNQTFEQSPILDLTPTWNLNLEAAVCEACDWSYLLPQGSLPRYCPHCFNMELSPLAAQVHNLPYPQPPELVIPFNVPTGRLAQTLQNFAGGIWFAPKDLNLPHLKERLQRLYLPMWLVDSHVEARWQAEAGFNYEVVSHQDKFNEKQGGWVSQQITETRVRWEPRLGRLARTYNNIPAPALEEHAALQQKLGPYNLEAAQPYQAAALAEAVVRLPNRPLADAWPEAIPALQQAAAAECRQACRADHWRNFRWQPTFNGQHWTLLLLPLYLTYYLDDNQQPQAILINGQTGHLSGPRRASMKRAQRAALALAAIALALFILSLVVALASIFGPRLLAAAGLALALAIIAGLLALLPPAIAWHFNRSNP